MTETRKYQLGFRMAALIGQTSYERWLARKAATHARRDRRRGNSEATIEAYKVAIHRAIEMSDGCDAYTGEILGWHLVSTYDNEHSKIGRREYKASLGLLPTVDHVGDGLGTADFKICSWRTNSAKNDLSEVDFIDLCRRVVRHHEQLP